MRYARWPPANWGVECSAGIRKRKRQRKEIVRIVVTFRGFLDHLRQASELVDFHEPMDIRGHRYMVHQSGKALFFHGSRATTPISKAPRGNTLGVSQRTLRNSSSVLRNGISAASEFD